MHGRTDTFWNYLVGVRCFKSKFEVIVEQQQLPYITRQTSMGVIPSRRLVPLHVLTV